MRSIIMRRLIGVAVVVWTMIVFGFFAKDAFHLKKTIQEIATAEARANYNKDKADRLWAASQGGVYVPISAETPPNPYLAEIPDRDVITSSGQHLTLMNPAYLARQLMGYYSKLFGAKAHITSLHYFRTETAPDEWEQKALRAFEKGRPEVLEISNIDGASYLRLMRPLKAEPACLKCHQHQGYHVGDIRGGVSVSIPMKPYLALWRKGMISNVISFGLIWCLGLVGLALYNTKMSKPLRELEKTEASLRISKENYRVLVENSLTGIYVSQQDRIVFANSEFARIHGYRLDEIIGLPSSSIIHPDDRAMVAERTGRRLQGQPLSNEYRVRGLTKSGAIIYVQRRNALTSFNGQPAVIGNEIDVTGQMVAEAELAVSERQLQKLADGLIEQREIEHEHFARQIHENIAQCLSAIKFQVESVLNDGGKKTCCEAHQGLQPIAADVQHTLTEIRKLARQYNPIGLEHMGILPSLTWLCMQFDSACPGIRIEKAFFISEADIPDPLKIIIFRMAEQMLHSVSGHPAPVVKMGLDLIANQIVFYLQTNVSAVELNSSPDQGFLQVELAMIALKRRIEKFGGSFRLSSSQDKGTFLIATWDICCRYPAGISAEQHTDQPSRQNHEGLKSIQPNQTDKSPAILNPLLASLK
jgi:PAS domain S-box-containing protein